MVYLKACPKCQGDMTPDQDGDLACIQCGFVRYRTAPLPFVRMRGMMN